MTDTVASFEKAAQFRKLVAGLKEAGWPVYASATPAVTVAGPRVYVCDVESSTMRMVVLAKDAIELTMANPHAQQIPAEQANDHAQALFAEMVSRKREPTEDEKRYEGAVLALYLARTTAYTMAKAQINDSHFIVVRYRCAKTGIIWNRMVGALGSGQLGPADIEGLANQVLATDRQRCPERFARATVLEFRARPS